MTEHAAPSVYPLRVEGELDAHFSRWLWLVKWIPIIPDRRGLPARRGWSGVGSLDPVTPGPPCEPGAPTEPVRPRGPVGPVAPVGPVGPDAPTRLTSNSAWWLVPPVFGLASLLSKNTEVEEGDAWIRKPLFELGFPSHAIT